MREILFRGKRTDNGKMVYGDLYHHTNGDTVITAITGGRNTNYTVDPETVGQYTGLTDKNGVKIFEGDIVKIHKSLYLGKPAIGKIVWLHGGLWYDFIIPIHNQKKDRTAINGLLAFEKSEPEVIGNIHDNPELFTGD